MGPEEPRVERRLAAIFAADVVGYSRLMGRDEAGTLRALSAARATMSRLITEYSGRLVNTVGDSLLAEFPSAVDAVKCAMVVQERLAQAGAESAEGPRLCFRIAVHVGDVLPSGGDIFGDGINVCSRLQELAEPRGICISGSAYQYVRKVLPVAFADLGERTLKNIDEPVRVFAIRPMQATERLSPQPKPSTPPDPVVPSPRAKMRTLDWVAAAGLAATIVLFLVYQFAPLVVPARTDFYLTPIVRDLYRIATGFVIIAWALHELARRGLRMRTLPRSTLVVMSLLLGSAYAGVVTLVWIIQFDALAILFATLPPGAIDAGLAGGLFAVTGFELYRRFPLLRGSARLDQQELISSVQSATQVQPQALPSTSVAVLPFLNLSGDPEQDFLADGITVEITSALANLPGLLVIGRVSAFRFKGHSQDLRDIGRQLGTTHLIEGSVRKEENRLRITAELIKAADGVCIWADRYDRDATDIFKVQEEIASAIARAMNVSLGLKLVRNSTNFEHFEKYLRAKALIRMRGVANLTQAASLLEQVVDKDCDPKFAPAWAMLAIAYCLRPNYDPAWFIGDSYRLRAVVKSCIPKAEAAARTAIALDPTDEHAYFALAFALAAQGRFIEAERNYEKAHGLDPGNPDVLHGYSGFLIDVGRLPEALSFRRQLLKLEPFVSVFTWVTATVLWLNGHNDEAIVMLERLPPDNDGRNFCLARIYASVGRYDEAADALEKIAPGWGFADLTNDASRLIRAAPTIEKSPAALPTLGSLGFIYLYVGARERFLEFFEGNTRAGYFCNSTGWLWHPSYAEVWRTPRFKNFIRSTGLLEYWRDRRYPDRIASADRSVVAVA